MTQTLTTIGHHTAFNNEQSPWRIVSYKRPRYDPVKQFKREKLTALFVSKNEYVCYQIMNFHVNSNCLYN